MKVLLLGYMGSGKSSILKSLGALLKLENIDLDDYIEEKEGSSIKDIFKNKGEIYFRKQENVYLKELLESNNNFVLALGGGTPCYANNIDLIKKTSNSFYLSASLNTLFERLRKGKADRPIIADLNDEKLKEFIAKHLFERTLYYEQARYKIVIDNKTVDLIADEINKLI